MPTGSSNTRRRTAGNSRWRAVARGALALCLAWAQVLPAWAAPAQEPLLGRVGAPVPPNLMMTLDDSGSMSWNFMPDTSFVAYSRFHPAEPGNSYGYAYNGTFATRDNNWGSAAARSAGHNILYYNPEIRYRPWTYADGSSMPQADPRAARVHPIDATLGTADLVGIQTLNGTFCYSNAAAGGSFVCNNVTNESFAPATYYDKIGTDARNGASFRRVRIADYATFQRGAGRTDCTPSGTGTSCTQAQEYQNFANWYTYNRTRIMLAISALSGALAEQGTNLRLGYGAINAPTVTIDGVSTRTVVRGVRSFSGADREQFFTWLHRVPPTGGTPLRVAQGAVGEYFSRADNAGPWGHVPGTSDAKAHLACRKSYHILMTDGYSDTTLPSNPAVNANVDGASGPLISGPGGKSYQYKPTPPYSDAATGTLADIAMYYWYRDLRPDLPNVVAPDGTDPAFWQHMSTFTIGLGVNGTLRYPQDFDALSAGTMNWPSAVASASPAAVDDLWHAAVNGRGRYLSAMNAAELRESLGAILKQITRASSAGVGVGVSGRVLDGNNKKFRPSYVSGSWAGELTALAIDAQGALGAELWKASEKMPAASARNLFVGTGGRSPAANAFQWDALNADQKSALGQSATASKALVDYLRGDASGEGNTYRARDNRLGDIVNSTPTYVKSNVDSRYQSYLPAGTPGRDTYAEFVKSKAARTGVVYVGANDGMLHAFRETDGVEIFGFMPRAVLGRVGLLSNPGYEHLYYVDGPLTEADAYLGSGWANVLVGSTGAGARSIFALNVTDPTALGAGSVMWEFGSADDSQMGSVLTPIEVGRLKDGQWAAVFGNGYQSAGQRPSLFIVNLQNGTLIKRIDVGSTGSGSAPNGLGGVRVLRDGQQTIIGAYAGDLQGNVWKFDLSASASSGWQASFGGQPLYRATRADGSPQAITAPPALVSHPKGGYMVLVGTGKLFEEGDQLSSTQESLYGLWDQQKLVETSTDVWRLSSEGPITSSSQIKASTVTADGTGFYTIAAPTLNWTTDRGWSIAITQAAGQRQIVAPQLITGLALFETLVPGSTSAVEQCETSNQAYGYSVLVDPINGGQSNKPTIDRNRDGVVNDTDTSTGVWMNSQWNGTAAVLAEQTRPVCTGAGCQTSSATAVCPAGTVRSNLQSLAGGGTNVCVAVPAPSRWWWRQVSNPN